MWLHIINTGKLFKTMISGKICTQLHCLVTYWVCHSMRTAISRHTVTVMKCKGKTVWAKQVSADNTAVNQKWDVKHIWEWRKTMWENKKSVSRKINCIKKFRKLSSRWTALLTLHCIYANLIFSRKTVYTKKQYFRRLTDLKANTSYWRSAS